MNLCVGESEDWQHTIFSLTLTDVEKCAFRGWTHKSKVQLTFSSPTAIQLTAVPVHSPPEDPEPPRLLIFSQITFVALFALCRAFCSLVVVGAAAWTMPHTQSQARAGCLFRFVASSIYSITFLSLGPCGSAGVARFIRSAFTAKSDRLAWAFIKQSLSLLLFPEGSISALTFDVFIPCDLSSSRHPPPHPSMCTNHLNAACRTNSLKSQFHLTLTTIIKPQSHR